MINEKFKLKLFFHKAEQRKAVQACLFYLLFCFPKKLKQPKGGKRIKMKNLSETKAGIMALNVVSEDDFLEINGVKIERKEYNGVPVLTSWDIAKIHEKENRRINENFKNVKEKLVLNEDYFALTRKEISESNISIQKKIPNNVKTIYLFTEMGYLMLSKTFSDEFSWQIQRELIKNYFKLKKLKNALENGEIEIVPKSQPKPYSPSEYELTNQKIEMMKTENEKEKLKLELGNSFERIADKIINEKMKNTLLIYSANSLAGKEILQLPAAEKLSFEAGKIAEKLNEKYGTNISGNRIGRIAKEYKLKTSEYGYWAYDKSRSSTKQVETFRYYENVVDKIYEIIMNDNELKNKCFQK